MKKMSLGIIFLITGGALLGLGLSFIQFINELESYKNIELPSTGSARIPITLKRFVFTINDN